MITKQTGPEWESSPIIERWSAYLEELHARLARRFQRPEVRARAYRYLAGLLGDVRRKNSWQMAQAIGEARPRGVQHLLNDARWEADLVRDDLGDYVVEHIGDQRSGVLIVDETGFLKKGEKSVGVARQYTGTAGKRENCQVGVFLCYGLKERGGFHRPGAVPARRVGLRPRSAGGGWRSRGGWVRYQGRVGKGYARSGVRGGDARPLGGGGHRLRDGERLTQVARRTGLLLRAGGARNSRRLPRRVPATGADVGQGLAGRGMGQGFGREREQG